MTNSCAPVGETVQNFAADLVTQYDSRLTTPNVIPVPFLRELHAHSKIILIPHQQFKTSNQLHNKHTLFTGRYPNELLSLCSLNQQSD